MPIVQDSSCTRDLGPHFGGDYGARDSPPPLLPRISVRLCINYMHLDIPKCIALLLVSATDTDQPAPSHQRRVFDQALNISNRSGGTPRGHDQVTYHRSCHLFCRTPEIRIISQRQMMECQMERTGTTVMRGCRRMEDLAVLTEAVPTPQ